MHGLTNGNYHRKMNRYPFNRAFIPLTSGITTADASLRDKVGLNKKKYVVNIQTVINRCKKSDFKEFEKMSDNIYKLRWGYNEEVERVSVYNDETGEMEFTGEVKETDWCTFESILYRNILTRTCST